VRIALVAVLALVLAQPALAWTPISTTPLHNIDRPSLLRTSAGTELAAWDDEGSGLWLWSSKGGPARRIETVPFVSQPQIVQQPNGAIQIYVGSGTGVQRFQSTDDGATWAGPYAIVSPTTVGPVVSAAVRPDGTPMFTQDGTYGVNVFQGLNGEQWHTVFTACCGYAESLAVDPDDYAQIAFWSNAAAFPSLFVYEGLDGNGAQAGPGRAFGQPQTAPHDDSVPLVASGSGSTFMGFAAGYPSATAFAVNAFQGGNLGWSTVVAGGTFGGGDPHMALSADPANRLWAVWSQGGSIRARRSRSDAHHFGAATAAGVGGATVYQVAALALADGRVDAFLNDGTTIRHQVFLPGLTVRATKATAAVLDDGVGVKATLKGGGHTVKTNGAGAAKLRVFTRGTKVTVTAAGYAATSFRKP
jgi:hypothetical protein